VVLLRVKGISFSDRLRNRKGILPTKPVPLIFLPGSFQEQVERENKMRCNDNLPMLIYKTEVVVVIALLSVSSIFSGVLVNFYVTTEEVG